MVARFSINENQQQRQKQRKKKTSFLRELAPNSESANHLYLAVLDYGTKLERKYHDDSMEHYRLGNKEKGDEAKRKRDTMGAWLKNSLESIEDIRTIRFKEENIQPRKYRPKLMELPKPQPIE